MQLHLIFYTFAGFLLLLEAFSPGVFIFACFAIASSLVGLAIQLYAWNLQSALIAELLISLLALFLVRPILKAIIKVPAEYNPKEFGTYAEKLIGREAMVFKAITKTELGVVKLLDYDETWLARSEDGSEIGQGSSVFIHSIDGNHLIVAVPKICNNSPS